MYLIDLFRNQHSDVRLTLYNSRNTHIQNVVLGKHVAVQVSRDLGANCIINRLLQMVGDFFLTHYHNYFASDILLFYSIIRYAIAILQA